MNGTNSLRQRAGVLTILLGMLLSLMAVVASPQPAFADSSCDGIDGPAGRIFESFTAQLTRTSGTAGLAEVSVDTSTASVSCIDNGSSVAIYLNDGSAWGVSGTIQIKAVGKTDAPDLHLSCSVDYNGATFAIGESTYTASSAHLAISSAPGNSGANCVERPSASLTAGACTFDDDTSTYAVTYSLDINGGDTPFALFVDSVEDTSVILTEGTDQSLGSYAPGTVLQIKDDSGVEWASLTVPSETCQPVDAVASLSVGECVFNQSSAYPVTYSLTVNDGDGPFTLFVDGVEDTTVTLADGDDQSLGDFAPGTSLEIRDGDAVLASITVSETACPPTEPTPAITLIKDAVVGEGSDLVAGDPNPLLQFSSSDESAQTALYSYLITNTGDEPLINLSLEDDRIGDLDMSDCPEVLGVGDSCTATGSEDFTTEQAQAIVDDAGVVTNTGTVEADGEESGTSVDDTDPATIGFEVVLGEVVEKEEPEPAPVETEQPAPVVLGAEELPATGWDAEELLLLSVLLMAIGSAGLWLQRRWVRIH